MIYSSQTEMKRPICYATSANNEIDSDYFAVVSECESYGQETDAELSITAFALRAAGYVDALVESLEKALQRIAELDKDCRVYENNVKIFLNVPVQQSPRAQRLLGFFKVVSAWH